MEELEVKSICRECGYRSPDSQSNGCLFGTGGRCPQCKKYLSFTNLGWILDFDVILSITAKSRATEPEISMEEVDAVVEALATDGCLKIENGKLAHVITDIHTLRSALWLARQAMAAHDVPDAGARSAVDAALLATGGLEVNDTPAGQAVNYQEEQ